MLIAYVVSSSSNRLHTTVSNDAVPNDLFFVNQHSVSNSLASRKYHRYFPRRYDLTLSVRNHNVTEAKFFRLNGVGHTADFYVAPGDVFTKTYEASLREIMEVYYYPGAVGFSDWHRVHGDLMMNNEV
ncbi:hypothetical protein Tcan_13189 [Toxocara canis]|uniref:Uncharacterized protein n=1 Tax=Toxocara canis TaxID=6265 RepID=A0A0B2W5S6_TOXCA|nr:hypothetical protein Tcan_13189 [Toxocara canis]